VAGIGLGIQGIGNLKAMLARADVRVVAVCDVHASQRANGKKVVDAHYGDQSCATYRDHRELLARPDLDAVLICTPDHGIPSSPAKPRAGQAHVL